MRGDAHTQNAPVEATGGLEGGHQPRALVNGGGGTYNPRSAWLFVDSKRRVLPDIDGNTMSSFYNKQRRHSLSLFPAQWRSISSQWRRTSGRIYTVSIQGTETPVRGKDLKVRKLSNNVNEITINEVSLKLTESIQGERSKTFDLKCNTLTQKVLNYL